MIPKFKFNTNSQLLFGDGSFQELHRMIPQFVSPRAKVLIVKGSGSLDKSPYWEHFQRNLREKNLHELYYTVHSEPTPELIDQACELFKNEPVELIIGIGGGSVLDTGKAISAMLPINGKLIDYLEGVGTKQPTGEKIPFIAVPTTSGTGSEATKNAVISRTGKDGFKKSLRHEAYIPDIAVVDPVLTMSCPPSLTANSGLDAFTQLLESYLSVKSNPLTDTLAYEGMRVFFQVFERAYENGGDLQARAGMAYSAYLSGVTLANAGLGTVHGIAGILGGYKSIPHGNACATLIEVINRKTVRMMEDDPAEYAEPLYKYARVGELITGNVHSAEDNREALLDTLAKWTVRMEIPRLSEFGFEPEDLSEIARKSSNKNNPVKFKENDIWNMLSDRL